MLISVVVSALVTVGLADSATTSTTTATTQRGPGDDAETIGAEYVVHPDIHPLERIQQWTEQIEKNNGSTWAAGAPLWQQGSCCHECSTCHDPSHTQPATLS